MPPLTDPDRMAAFIDALRNWNVTGYVVFDLTEQSSRWVYRELGITHRDISHLMFEHVDAGGRVDEVLEVRPEWFGKHEFHHDLRLTINRKQVYIETRLKHRIPVLADESSIVVVNIHEV